MRFKHIAMIFAVFALSLALLACSSSDDGDAGDNGNGDEATATAEPTSDGNGDEPTATAEPAGNGGGGFGSGTGTLTIGDESYEITGIGCVFSAEDAGNPDFPFNLSGFGESSTGARAQFSADIYDPTGQERHEGEEVSHNVSFDDIEDFANPSVSWESYHQTVRDTVTGGTAMTITIDGKTIHGEGTFNDLTTDEFELVPGTMDVQCP